MCSLQVLTTKRAASWSSAIVAAQWDEVLSAPGEPVNVEIPAEQAAKDIYNAMRKRKQEIYTAARWRLVMFVIRNIPSFIFRKLSF